MPIHPTAEVHASAVIDPGATIGPRAVILENVVIGEGCEIMAGAVIGPNVRMGKGNIVHPYAVVGGAPQHLAVDPKIRSGVLIGEGNTFREFVTVHRAIHEGADTVLGNGNYIMATAHIAHDCRLGNSVVVTNSGNIAGHVEIGDRAFISSPAGVHQFVRIGRLAIVGALSGVGMDVPPFSLARGINTISGLNSIGMRRAGITSEARLALKVAFRILFRENRPLPGAIAEVRAQFAAAMPPEVAEVLAFCETKSKRGICRGPRRHAASHYMNDEDEEGD